MNASLATVHPAESSPRLDLPRLLLIGAALPAAIAGANYALAAHSTFPGRFALVVYLQFVWYVAQVGLVGYAVGRGIAQPFARWIVFGWILLLIDLLAGTFAMNEGNSQSSLLSAALWAGQTGLCVVWAFFGTTRWTLRWPAMIVAAACLQFLWLSFGSSWGLQLWTELLILQVVTLAVLCGLLRLFGFRLAMLDAAEELPAADGSQRRPLQFGIKHVLIWTTTLAILLGVARGMDLLRWQVAQDLVRTGMPWKLTVAATSAIVIIVALWTALGQGHWALRLAVGLNFTLLAGSGLSLCSLANVASARRAASRSWTFEFWQMVSWYEVGWWWLAWLFLSGGLLASTLIILRVLGYRLVRVRRASNHAISN